MKANEILSKYPSVYTKDDVKAARNWLAEQSNNRYNGCFAAFGWGDMQGEQLAGPCHGSVGRFAPMGPLLANLTKPASSNGYSNMKTHITRVDPDLARRWFTWLVRDGYWAPFYVETTVDEAIESGCLVPTTLPANLMQGCNILTRHNHEHPETIKLWGRLVDLGMSEDIAYLVSFCWGLTLTSAEQNMPMSLGPLGHNAVGNMSPSVVRNFLERNYNNLIEPFYPSSKKYQGYGLSSMIPYDEQETPKYSYEANNIHLQRVLKFLTSFKTKTKTTKVTSPFAKRTVNPYGYNNLLMGFERPGAKLVLTHPLEIEEWLRKEYQ